MCNSLEEEGVGCNSQIVGAYNKSSKMREGERAQLHLRGGRTPYILYKM